MVLWASSITRVLKASQEISRLIKRSGDLREIVSGFGASAARSTGEDASVSASRLAVEGEKPELALEFSIGARGCRQNTVVLA